VALHGLEIEGLAAVTIFADELEIGQRGQYALGHRLEADDGRIAVLEKLDQLVLVEAMTDIVKLRIRMDVEHLLAHGGMTGDAIGGDTEAIERGHCFSSMSFSVRVAGALDALGIHGGCEAKQAPAREMGEQERMRAPFIEAADVAFEQRFALIVGEWPIRDGGGRVLLHGLPKGDIMKHAVAELVDLIRAHELFSLRFTTPFVPAKVGTQELLARSFWVRAFAGTNGEACD